MDLNSNFSAFLGTKLYYSGSLRSLLKKLKSDPQDPLTETLLIFEESSGQQIDFDLRGTLQEVLERAFPGEAKAGPGRPKLGVVSREVTLLPKHWQWLEAQNPGISGALRRLVDEAMRQEPDAGRAKRLRDALGRLLWSLAGNLEGFEEASRALYARNGKEFRQEIKAWPEEIREYSLRKLKEIEALEAA